MQAVFSARPAVAGRKRFRRIGGFGHLLFFGQGRFLDHADTGANITLLAREVLQRLRELNPEAKEPATAAAE